MGSYAILKAGHFNLGEWKSHVPLEPLLLFTQEDYREDPCEIDGTATTTHKAITPDARHTIESAVEGKRQVIFLDIDRLVGLIKDYRFVQYLLFTPLS